MFSRVFSVSSIIPLAGFKVGQFYFVKLVNFLSHFISTVHAYISVFVRFIIEEKFLEWVEEKIPRYVDSDEVCMID